jgi:hypothetical protein
MRGTLNEIVGILTDPFVLTILGLLAHFLRKLIAGATHENAKVPSIVEYWFKNPAQSAIALIGAIAGYAMFAHFPDFNSMAPDIKNVVRTTAFGVGYMADNMVDAIGGKTMDRIRGTKP